MPRVTQASGGQPLRARPRPGGRARRPGRRTTTHGSAPSGRVARAATAPAAAAAPRKSCPSTRSPATATNRSPAATVAGVEGHRAGHRRRRRGRSSDRRPAERRPILGAGVDAAIMRARRPGSAPGEHLAQHRAVVERVHGAGDLLAGLVALAGDQQGVARAGQARRRRPGRRAGRRTSSTSARSVLGHLLDAGEHRGPDRGRVLGARVVVGHDQDIAAARPQRSPSPAVCRDRGRRRSPAR